MTKLTQEQVRTIGKHVSDGVALEEVLPSQFPDARIAVIRGYDNFSDEAYTKGAFFDEDQAKQVMGEIPPNGTLPDTYHVVTGTVQDLQAGNIIDMKTRLPLDDIDRSMVYSSLQERLSE